MAVGGGFQAVEILPNLINLHVGGIIDIGMPAHFFSKAFNDFPVVIGGGNRMENATVMILEKKKGELRIKVLDAKGNVLLDIVE